MSTFLLESSIMFQTILVRKRLVHLPSVASLSLRKSVIGRPVLAIRYHNGRTESIRYGWLMWDQARWDYQTLQKSMITCWEVLKPIPWMERQAQPTSSAELL